jgi:transcriptional regulator with XRE-family HTH domain
VVKPFHSKELQEAIKATLGGALDMGELSSAIRQAMEKKNLRQIDVAEASGGLLTQSALASLLGGHVTLAKEKIRLLAKLLDVDAKDLLQKATIDKLNAMLRKTGLDMTDIVKGIRQPARRIPLYKAEELETVLDQSGSPLKEASDFMPALFHFGDHAYAVVVKDPLPHQGVMPGDIIVVSQESRLNLNEVEGDLGVIGLRRGGVKIATVALGSRSKIVVRTVVPYQAWQFKRKDILFMHKVACIVRSPTKPF